MNEFDTPVVGRLAHVKIETQGTVTYRPHRDLVTVCTQPNGYTVHVRAYTQATAAFDRADWAKRGEVITVRRSESAYRDIA